MRWWLLATCIVLAGCGTVNTGNSGRSAEFPEVTNRLRAACEYKTDAQIAASISLFEAELDAGWTELQAYDAIAVSALEWYGDTETADMFVLCMVTIVDAVWP